MSDDSEPFQVDEVVAAITTANGCAIVHRETGIEVEIFNDIYNKNEPWGIRTIHSEIPDKPVLHEALVLGFELRSREMKQNFGLNRGSVITLYELHRNCLGVRAAAIKAVTLARLFPGVGAKALLWITVSEYDKRGNSTQP